MTAAPPLTFAGHTAVFHLHSPDASIRRGWRQIMGSFLQPTNQPATAALHLTLTESLPPWPHEQRLYQDAGPGAVIDVYADDTYWWLHYHDGALVQVPRQQGLTNETAVCRGWLTPQAITVGRLEDVTYTSLAPILRRRGIFLLHAFAASRHDQTCLIIGPSGSGKTTTGLWLLSRGWKLLANDVVMLREQDDQIWAAPTPNLVGIRPPTLTFLPQLSRRLALDPRAAATLTADDVANGRFADPAPVTHLYFLAGSRQADCAVRPLPDSLAVTRLMAESVDRWDTAMLPAHLAFLAKLAGQADTMALTLGNHPDKLAISFPVEARER